MLLTSFVLSFQKLSLLMKSFQSISNMIIFAQYQFVYAETSVSIGFPIS